MTLFYLPDLGEGLISAKISRWYVKKGDHIKVGEPMVRVETDKALVDIPAPFSGEVIQLYGKSNEDIGVNTPLVNIKGKEKQHHPPGRATVVGNLQSSDLILEEPVNGIQFQSQTTRPGIQVTPALRALAKKRHVNLSDCVGTGPAGLITVADVEAAAQQIISEKSDSSLAEHLSNYQPLQGVRRAMAIVMARSHQSVVPVTLVDDVDIHAWPEKVDITLRIIQAIAVACQQEPRLNAWVDDNAQSVCQHHAINLGIAIDTPKGLFVPVLQDIANSNAVDLRQAIDEFKEKAKQQSFLPQDLRGATFVLSNVGVFAGRYATPIITPPTVAILVAGHIRQGVVADEYAKPVVHRLLPLSLTVDHRVVTGGEAARFLSALMADLQAP